MSHFKSALFGGAALLFGIAACGGQSGQGPASAPAETHGQAAPVEVAEVRAFTADKFTQSNYTDVRVTHLALDLDVDFDAKVLRGTATLDFERIDPDATELVLDTKGLTISNVMVHDSAETYIVAVSLFELGAADPVLGAQLSIPIGSRDTGSVVITYETSPEAEGLQWLSPAQTAGKTQPYLFSQAQALNARTMAPVQDTPAVRMTYSAKLRVPEGIVPLMSASQDGRDGDGAYMFNMP